MTDENENGAGEVAAGNGEAQEVDFAMLQAMQIASLLIGEGFNESTAKNAAVKSVQDMHMLHSFLQTRGKTDPNNLWGFGLKKRMSLVGAQAPSRFLALKSFDHCAGGDQELAVAMMVAITSSPLARAFLYARGWDIDWFEASAKPTPQQPKLIV